MNNHFQENNNYHILIVEDDPVAIQTLVAILSSQYTLSVAKNVKKAMSILESTSVDFILLDVNLPDGNGFDVCKKVVSDKEKYPDTTIIFMTAMQSAEQEARGLELGAADYIYKPINDAVLKARLNLQVQLKRKNKLLSNLAKIDGLTEIPNRRALDTQLTIEWNRAKRDHKLLSIALIDVDYFKQYNDHYGHPKGDECLKELAKCLSQHCKRSSDFCARYGGEEFAMLMFDTKLDDAMELLQRTLDSFTQLNITHEYSTASDVVTFSAGVCTANPTLDSLEDFLDSADDMLYKAKSSGRNKIKGSTLSKN